MGLYGGVGTRNHGYGRKMDYAGQQALQARYGGGHFSTVATQGARWSAFSGWAKEQGIKDMRDVTPECVFAYADAMRGQGLAVSTRQNRISAINTVMRQAREGSWTTVSPRAAVGESRSQVRTEAPATLDPSRYQSALAQLHATGLNRAAAVLSLGRECGMRSEEAVKANLGRLLNEAATVGSINIQDGTKGGRDAPRWVPVTEGIRAALAAAIAARPAGSQNLLAPGESFKAWRSGELRAGREILHTHGIKGYHDARAAYACARYAQLTGRPAPVVAGQRTASKADDRAARLTIAGELGHGRSDVARAYVGSSR
ncbi:integrase domain-containing protein [Thiocapsa roseopersicina]|uniref:Integrase n=1 Tax=Thiocapsa roseopersicina TaxID=1058 RepID=A0A1H3DQ87_THIRO|nr:integrase domain-containing protein [Thiocapsa roseopersicina]SDX67844.1 Integrase [Thiocapsa roseopersicina]